MKSKNISSQFTALPLILATKVHKDTQRRKEEDGKFLYRGISILLEGNRGNIEVNVISEVRAQETMPAIPL